MRAAIFKNSIVTYSSALSFFSPRHVFLGVSHAPLVILHLSLTTPFAPSKMLTHTALHNPKNVIVACRVNGTGSYPDSWIYTKEFRLTTLMIKF